MNPLGGKYNFDFFETMDMFKLLSRSTGLRKSALSSRKEPQHIPSAGVPSHDSRIEHEKIGYEQTTKESHRGKKRKRRVLEESETNIPDELNYFAAYDEPNRPTKDEGVEHHKTAQRANGAASTNRSTVDGRVIWMSEEESRRVLKKQKLKITIFGDMSDAQQKRNQNQSNEAGRQDVKRQPHSQIWPQPLTAFDELRNKYGISSRLAENLDGQGYSEPTEVQLGALPLLLGSDKDRGLVGKGELSSKKPQKSDFDLLTIAPTGSGKTLAFLIPILQGLVEARHKAKTEHDAGGSDHHVQALIIAPTHELVDQIVNEARKLSPGTGIKVGGMKKGMRVQASVPGASTDSENAQDDGPMIKTDLLVSTPLMMVHAISNTSGSQPIPLPAVRYLVLDEADVLLDPLFREQTLGIWSACPNPLLQTSLWSATIGSSIENLARDYILSRRQTFDTKTFPASDHHIIRLVVGLKDSAIPLVTHRLIYGASEQGKLLALRQILHPTAPSSTDNDTNQPTTLQPPFLVFTQTISRAIALYSELRYDIPPEAGGSTRLAVLHADLSSTARSEIMAGLRKGEIWVVITTDLLSRGVDIRGLNGVVNYDIPTTGAAYIHRVGRTGRQGREGGVAVTLYTKEDIPYVKNIANVIAASERTKKQTTPTTTTTTTTTRSAANHHSNERPSERAGSSGIQKWLMDALPRVSKKTKQELKTRGVESRRSGDGALKKRGGGAGAGGGAGRISTKSGFERRLEVRRRGAVVGSMRRRREEEAQGDMVTGVNDGRRIGGRGVNENGDEDDDDGEWGGFDD